jgi:tetratricopeptide (TPR) repeat protein
MDQMITKTLAEIYLQQGHLEKAYEIFKALLEKDPDDLEVKKRLNELAERMTHSPPWDNPPTHSKEERIRLLERWLTNIRERKRR